MQSFFVHSLDAVFPPASPADDADADAADISFLSNYVATMSQRCRNNAMRVVISSNNDDRRKTVCFLFF